MSNSLRRYGIWIVIALVGALCWGMLALARGDDQRRVAAICGTGVLRHRLQVLRALHPGQGAGSGRLKGYSCGEAQQRPGLRAHGPEGALRAPLRGHSRGRTARRSRVGGPDGFLAWDHLDHRRRHPGRRGAGHDDPLLLHAKRRQEPGPDGEGGDRARRGVAALIAVLSIMVILLAVLALVVVNALAASRGVLSR